MIENIEKEPEELNLLTADPLELAKSRIADPELLSIVADFIKREQERFIEATKNMAQVPEGLKSVFLRKIQRMLDTPESLRGNK